MRTSPLRRIPGPSWAEPLAKVMGGITKFFVYFCAIMPGLCIAAGAIALGYVVHKNVAGAVASYVNKLSQTIANAAGDLVEQFVLTYPSAGAVIMAGLLICVIISSLAR